MQSRERDRGPMAVVQHHQNSTRITSPTSDSNGPATVSRLHLMQARFQQKQQQEKEQKLLALYADQAQQAYARISNGGGGKVRQLFQERRGLDRSYPLQPLEGRRGTSLDRALQSRNNNINNTAKRNNGQIRGGPPRYPSAGYEGDNIDFYYQPSPIFSSQQRLDQDFTAAIDTNFNIKHKPQSLNHQPQLQQPIQVFGGGGEENDNLSKSYDLDSTKVFKKLPNIGGASLSEQKAMMAPAKEQESPIRKPTTTTQLKTNRNSDAGVKSITKTMAKLTPPSIKSEVKPVQNSETKPKLGVRRPTPVPVTSNIITRPTSASSTDKQKTTKSEAKLTNISRTMSNNSRTPPKGAARPTMGMGGGTASQGDLVPCSICGRNFAKDRISAHQNICAKTTQKKRKPFDPIKQRLTGTGAERYLRKGGKPAPPPTNVKKSNWRKKHEEFITNIRAAKQAQAHVAAGGKLSDLPPPPPSDTSDYVQCPHCGRKFNEGAAARHIPKCATMLHNKPKPNAGADRLQAARKRY